MTKMPIAIRVAIEVRRSPIVPIAIVAGGSGVWIRISAEGVVVCNGPIWIAAVVRHNIGAAASEISTNAPSFRRRRTNEH